MRLTEVFAHGSTRANLVYEEDESEVLEWKPADALQILMDHIEAHARTVLAAG